MEVDNNNLLKVFHSFNKVANNFSLEVIHSNSFRIWDLASLMVDLLDNNKMDNNKVSNKDKEELKLILMVKIFICEILVNNRIFN